MPEVWSRRPPPSAQLRCLQDGFDGVVVEPFGISHEVVHVIFHVRLEARIALEETLARFSGWTVDEASAEMRITSAIRGYSKLPIHI